MKLEEFLMDKKELLRRWILGYNGVNLSFICCDRSMFASEISTVTEDSEGNITLFKNEVTDNGWYDLVYAGI